MTTVRFTAQEVANLRAHPGDVMSEEIVALCDSHEVYRGFAQEFIEIMAGTKKDSIAAEAAAKNISNNDRAIAQFFGLFLKIVGPIKPGA